MTLAVRLRQRFKGQFPDEPWVKIWERIYPLAIPSYATMAETGQSDARQELRERVRWRRSRHDSGEIGPLNCLPNCCTLLCYGGPDNTADA